ncbi:MAG TPA: hypothetical protein VHT30_09805 [Acidimicrobiales bacterium]|nr:hypothetical protein [Acidimicrobiales bacterium]
MATNERKAGSGGRTTPKGSVAKTTGPGPAKRTAPRPPRSLDPDKPVAVGRRPSSPGFLALVAAMWLAVGVVCFVALHSSWKLVPAIVSIGIGLMFLRGAGATVLRREHRRSPRD